MSEILYEDMYRAYLDCRRRKRNKKDAKNFELNAMFNITKLTNELNARKYKLSQSSCFIVEYPTIREVFCAGFRDRIVQHFVYNELNPIVEKTLIYDTASCRKGKGTDFAIHRVERFVRSVTDNYSSNAYYLKADLSGFFMSIDRQKLLDLVLKLTHQKYTGKYMQELEYLLPILILTDQTKGSRYLCSKAKWETLPKRKSLFGNPNGLPIGNITSQLFANLYLNDVDHFIKSRHHYYERYVDDMIVVDTGKARLYETLDLLRNLLPSLNLKLNEKKTRIGNVKYGIDFLGIKINPFYSVVGTKRVNRMYFMTKKISTQEEFVQSANSRKGMFTFYHGYRIAKRWYEKMVNVFPKILCLSGLKFAISHTKTNETEVPVYV